MLFLTPLFLVALSALAIPVVIHLVQRERRQVIPFPSLMFIRRIPYESVRRRRVRHWLLMLLRLAALLLIVLAFARPYFRRGPIASAAAASGGREVAIVLDRSASMAYGDHWARAQAAARQAVDRLGTVDRATLVLFDATAEEAVRSTGDRVRLRQAIDASRPGSGATRFGPALKLAASVLAKSPLKRREAVLVTDFQKSGWRGGEDARFGADMVLTPVPIGSNAAPNVSVPSVSLERAPFSGKERVTVTAAVHNFGDAPVNTPVSLQVGDNVVETVSAAVAPGSSASVAFAPFTLASPGMTALVRAGTDAMPDDNVFRFVLSPSPALSVLIVEADSGAPKPFLSQALTIGSAPRFQVDSLPAARVSAASLAAHPVVILNGVPASRIGTSALGRYVEQGGGLVLLLGGDADLSRASESADDPLPAPTVANDAADPHVTAIGFVDYSHPIFEVFQGPHGGDFSGTRVYRYRALPTAKGDRILARFSDGAPALVERRIGAGRVVAWTSTFDDSWNDLALKPVFLPFVQQIARYVSQYEERPAWRGVGQALDLADRSTAARISERAAALSQERPSEPDRIVLTPSGRRLSTAADGKPLRFVELEEQGFYEIRSQAQSMLPERVAVNLDPAESDLAPMDPQELAAAVTGRAQPLAAGGAPPPTTEELERRQSIWWYLLAAGLLLLGVETIFSNQLSGGLLGVKTRRGPAVDRSLSVSAFHEGRADAVR